jgi:hypothetical protein
MRLAEVDGAPPVMLRGVWGFCDCHGWQFDPNAIPDLLGQISFPEH